MGRRRRGKRSRSIRLWLLIGCACAGFVSFCLPWVTVIPAVIIPRVGGKYPLANTILDTSMRGMRTFSFNGTGLRSYAGFELPVVLWQAESNQLGKLLFVIAGKEHLKYYGLLMYLYPFVLMLVLLGVYRIRSRPLGIGIAIVACCAVTWVQVVRVGLRSTKLLPMSVYIDYGFWVGLAACLFFAVCVVYPKPYVIGRK